MKTEIKKNNPWSICSYYISKDVGTTNRNKWSEKDKERYERCVLNIKKKQNIVESQLNEIGGYDDKNIYARHSGSYMGYIKGNYNNIANSLRNLEIISNEILDDELKKSINTFLDNIELSFKKLKHSINKAEYRILRDLSGDNDSDEL